MRANATKINIKKLDINFSVVSCCLLSNLNGRGLKYKKGFAKMVKWIVAISLPLRCEPVVILKQLLVLRQVITY